MSARTKEKKRQKARAKGVAAIICGTDQVAMVCVPFDENTAAGRSRDIELRYAFVDVAATHQFAREVDALVGRMIKAGLATRRYDGNRLP